MFLGAQSTTIFTVVALVDAEAFSLGRSADADECAPGRGETRCN
jgi:hypothetical protein